MHTAAERRENIPRGAAASGRGRGVTFLARFYRPLYIIYRTVTLFRPALRVTIDGRANVKHLSATARRFLKGNVTG